MKPSELKKGDMIIGRDSKGKITSRIPVYRVGLCPSTSKGIPRIHVNDTLCYDDIVSIEVQ